MPAASSQPVADQKGSSLNSLALTVKVQPSKKMPVEEPPTPTAPPFCPLFPSNVHAVKPALPVSSTAPPVPEPLPSVAAALLEKRQPWKVVNAPSTRATAPPAPAALLMNSQLTKVTLMAPALRKAAPWEAWPWRKRMFSNRSCTPGMKPLLSAYRMRPACCPSRVHLPA